jgi:hypothetical protein
LQARLSGSETVLLKGSRGVALERLLPLMESAWGGAPGAHSAGGSKGASRGGD